MRLIFEKEWGRKEGMIYNIIRKEVKSYITPPARESSMDQPDTNLKGDASSEPDSSDVASSCIKVHDWLEEQQSEDSAAAEQLLK
ncbi:hypothetical protein GJAV_G00219060 [Gymnothorax javanicus]|nr:hypothetical protein GJAV_G00219060 [Gymnothorax javanicus]